MTSTELFELPHSLASISQKMAVERGYSSQMVLQGLTGLYEKGFITYPMTECRYLPESQHANAQRLVCAVLLASNRTLTVDPDVKSPAWNDEKVSESHGICPVDVNAATILFTTFTEVEMILYKEIVHAFVSLFGKIPNISETSSSPWLTT